MTGENDMTGRIGDEEKMERVWGGEAEGFVFDGFWRHKCRLRSGDKLPPCISFIIHIWIPSSERITIIPLSSCSSLHLSITLWSLPHPGLQRLPRQRHTGFNTPVSPQSAALFVRCVDAFIGLKWLLCSLPAVYSQAVIPLLTTVCGLVMQFV